MCNFIWVRKKLQLAIIHIIYVRDGKLKATRGPILNVRKCSGLENIEKK